MIRKEGVGQRPFSSSHLIFQKCLQHAIRPNRAMRPLVDSRGLSSRDSRKRHCGRGVTPPFGRLTFPRSGHLTSTSLLPFAPPRFAARLHRYYESSDFCRAASSDLTGIAEFAPLRRAILRRGPGPLFTQRPPLRILTMRPPRPSPDRSPCLSRLTFRPLHLQPPHCHFVTVALTRYFTAVTCRVYPPGQTLQVGGRAVARSRVRASPAPSPTGLAESSSLALRIGRSSQVAPHPSSRKRSYRCRLQAGNVSLEGTSTLLIKRLHRRTGGGFQAAVRAKGSTEILRPGDRSHVSYLSSRISLLHAASVAGSSDVKGSSSDAYSSCSRASPFLPALQRARASS